MKYLQKYTQCYTMLQVDVSE